MPYLLHSEPPQNICRTAKDLHIKVSILFSHFVLSLRLLIITTYFYLTAYEYSRFFSEKKDDKLKAGAERCLESDLLNVKHNE